ncbi:MAG: hypothetical protein IJV88_05775 [Ruminococcus sp.]|nr:hypothetical protein [Ruminococcus sp.]
MNVLYCGDKNIEDGLIISVLSLLRNTTSPLNIYVMTMRCEAQGKLYEPLCSSFADFMDSLLKKYDPESSFSLFDITELFEKEVPVANMSTRFTPGCMVRLFADCIGQLPDRILYLDNDVVCRRDPEELYNIGMEDTEMAGVLDHYGKWFFRRNIFKMDYVNSGVLMLNLREIRRTRLFERARAMCSSKEMFMPDQSALNKLSQSKKLMPRRFNEQRKLHEDTVLQHFTTSFRFFPWIHTVTVKPWQTDKVHSVLRLYEYDSLLEEYQQIKDRYIEKLKGETQDE